MPLITTTMYPLKTYQIHKHRIWVMIILFPLTHILNIFTVTFPIFEQIWFQTVMFTLITGIYLGSRHTIKRQFIEKFYKRWWTIIRLCTTFCSLPFLFTIIMVRFQWILIKISRRVVNPRQKTGTLKDSGIVWLWTIVPYMIFILSRSVFRSEIKHRSMK